LLDHGDIMQDSHIVGLEMSRLHAMAQSLAHRREARFSATELIICSRKEKQY
jgi:hypothetical protein